MFLSPSCSFSLPPRALFLREEYLPEFVSVVLLFCLSAVKHPSVCAVKLRDAVCYSSQQSTACTSSSSLKLCVVWSVSHLSDLVFCQRVLKLTVASTEALASVLNVDYCNLQQGM